MAQCFRCPCYFGLPVLRSMLGGVARCDPLPDRPGNLTWQTNAACLGLLDQTGEDLFFPPDNPGGPKAGKGVTGEKERVEKAKAICLTCPVTRECLGYAVDNDCQGVWGGTTEGERRKLRKKMMLRHPGSVFTGGTAIAAGTRWSSSARGLTL